MRWPGANLEEKHEPRGVSVAEAQNGDSMKLSGRNLTPAAIEKQSLVAGDSDGKKCPFADLAPDGSARVKRPFETAQSGGVHSARPSRHVLGFLTKTVAGRRADKYGQKGQLQGH